jgi:hypothetical protein
MEFKSTGRENEILDCGEFFISFNPAPFGGSGVFSSDDDSSETALCYDGKYKILNGDFREEYLKVAPDFDKCIAIYESNKNDCNSSWTS